MGSFVSIKMSSPAEKAKDKTTSDEIKFRTQDPRHREKDLQHVKKVPSDSALVCLLWN